MARSMLDSKQRGHESGARTTTVDKFRSAAWQHYCRAHAYYAFGAHIGYCFSALLCLYHV